MINFPSEVLVEGWNEWEESIFMVKSYNGEGGPSTNE